MPCYSPLKGQKDPVTGGITFRKDQGTFPMEVACGSCIGCRLDRANRWSMRMVHEASLHADTGGNSFVTLTYRNPEPGDEGRHVPADWSLDKSHFQKFMKRLRRGRPGAAIKYFHCGEYGRICKHGLDLELVKCPMCNLGRPHYHAILFNCSFSDLTPVGVQNGITRYTSDELEERWGYGRVDVGEVTPQSAGYVARYTLKKVTGDPAEEHYQCVDPDGTINQLQPEYATMSNGIGAGWYEKFKDDVFPSDEVPVPGRGVLRGAPRYYSDKLRKEDEAAYERLKRQRLRHKLAHPEEYTSERLMAKYKVKRAQIKTLERNL